jgi:hypothetical protein
MVHAGRAAGGGFRVAGVLPYGPQGSHAPDGDRERADSGPTATTFVDAADDFREQNTGALPGDAGTVIDWTGSLQRQKELDTAVGHRQTRHRKTKHIAIGCGIALLIVMGLGLAVGLLGVLLFGMNKYMVEPSVYDSVKVGDAETEVRHRLPAGNGSMTKDLAGQGPKKPAGATCLELMSTEEEDGQGRDRIFRFCFKDGKLIAKQSYRAKAEVESGALIFSALRPSLHSISIMAR